MRQDLKTDGASVVVVAYNEEASLPSSLSSVVSATSRLSRPCEVVLVDDRSTDRTAEIAKSMGVHVVRRAVRGGAGAARNAGAASSSGKWLVFFDADVTVSPFALEAMFEAVDHDRLSLAGFRAVYRPEKLSSWVLCAVWDWKRDCGGPCQGVGQLVDRRVFEELGGYREDWLMGEDTEFYARAQQWADRHGATHAIVQDAVIWPSTRRLDAWSTLRMWALQNPVTARVSPRSSVLWGAWHDDGVR